MNRLQINRRQFIRHSAVAVAGTALLSRTLPSAFAAATKRTASEQVTLGKTGIKLSRLGIGTGSANSNGIVTFEDSEAGKYPSRYYRAVAQ